MTADCTKLVYADYAARFYAWMARRILDRHLYRRFQRDLAEMAPAKARLLDIGTGPGFLLRNLILARPDVQPLGLDISYQMLCQGQQRKSRGSVSPRLLWVVAAAESLPFSDETFDQVLATLSLHHWSKPATGLQEAWRVLKPRGRVWIYEMRRETSMADVLAFSREEQLSPFLVYLLFKISSLHSSLGAKDFSNIFCQTGIIGWDLSTVHHLFWRAEITKP